MRNAHVFIIMLSPKWIESGYCRKEYSIFADEVEAQVEPGEYIFAIMARDIDKQAKHFSDEQITAYEHLQQRQNQKALTKDFVGLTAAQRNSLLEKMADDITGMLERLRSLPETADASGENKPSSKRKRSYEFKRQPYNFHEVDIVSDAEFIIENNPSGDGHSVFAQCSFVEHLYVQADNVRVEFGVQRCFVSLRNGGNGNLHRVDLDQPASGVNVRYISLREVPDALTLSVTAPPGGSLGDLPLQPAEGQNRLAKIATLPEDCKPGSLSAELSISLSPDGLWIAGENTIKPTARSQKKIAAILNAAVQKEAQAAGTEKLKRTYRVVNKDGKS